MPATIHRVSAEELNAPREAPAIPKIATLGSVIFVDDKDATDATDDLDNTGAEETYHALILEREDKTKIRVFIKVVDVMTAVDIEAGRLLVQGHDIVRAPGRESKLCLALEVAATVYKRIAGEVFEPFFADVKAAQTWMGKPKNKPLVGRILTGIYIANPELSPQKKMQAARSQT